MSEGARKAVPPAQAKPQSSSTNNSFHFERDAVGSAVRPANARKPRFQPRNAHQASPRMACHVRTHWHNIVDNDDDESLRRMFDRLEADSGQE